MTATIKKVLIGLAIVFALLVFASLLITPPPEDNNPVSNTPESPSAAAGELPPAPSFATAEKRYEVAEIKPDNTYRVLDLADNAEVELFIPADANITAGQRSGIAVGTIITVQRYMEVANGLVAAELSIATAQ